MHLYCDALEVLAVYEQTIDVLHALGIAARTSHLQQAQCIVNCLRDLVNAEDSCGYVRWSVEFLLRLTEEMSQQVTEVRAAKRIANVTIMLALPYRAVEIKIAEMNEGLSS
jgi:hypothetical protein